MYAINDFSAHLTAGIVLTGWSRYDHFAVLCELLPAAVPSLAVALLATSHGYWNSSLAPPLYKAPSCGGRSRTETEIDLDNDNFLWEKLSWCHFPGEKFFKVTKELVALEGEVAEFFAKVDTKRGWMTPYNVRHNMSSPFRIEDVSRLFAQHYDLTGTVEVLEDWSRTQHAVVSLMRTAAAALSEVYDQFTVAEWVEQKLYPFYSRLSQLRQQADTMRGVHSWPARPYPPLQVSSPATAFSQYYLGSYGSSFKEIIRFLIKTESNPRKNIMCTSPVTDAGWLGYRRGLRRVWSGAGGGGGPPVCRIRPVQ